MKTPKVNDIVYVGLASGVTARGRVVSWDARDNNDISWLVIKTLDNKQEINIQHFYIVEYAVCNDYDPENSTFSEERKVVVEDESKVKPPKNIDINERAKFLADNKIKKIKFVKSKIRDHMSRMDTNGVRETEYEMPSFTKYT